MAHTILEPTYITAAEIKDNTCNAELINLGIPAIENLIVKAQIIVDNYIGDVGEKADETQYFKFPTKDITTIPTNVTMATMYVVEALFGNGKKEFGKEIKAESWDGYSKTYKDGNSSFKFELISGTVRSLLKEYGVNKNNLNMSAFSINY